MTERYCEVRYEELHADGPREIMRLFAWLGEPVSREEAESYVAASAFEKVRPTVSSPEDVDAQFYRRGEVDSWRRELSGSDIAIIERLTRKQMAELGYEPRTPIEEGLRRNPGIVATAMHCVNAVPYVCAAEPGLLTYLDLPLVSGRAAAALGRSRSA